MGNVFGIDLGTTYSCIAYMDANGKPVVLTNKEFGLLVLFIRNKNVALFRETLYEKVWEDEYISDSRTLDLHVQRLRRKLGWEQNLVAVYKVGYRLEVSD